MRRLVRGRVAIADHRRELSIEVVGDARLVAALASGRTEAR